MTRSERIQKLTNAVKEYRGRYDLKSGKWIYPPNPAARTRCIRWLESLRLDVPSNMEAIEGFKLIQDFDQWLKSLD